MNNYIINLTETLNLKPYKCYESELDNFGI